MYTTENLIAKKINNKQQRQNILDKNTIAGNNNAKLNWQKMKNSNPLPH